MSFVDIPNKKLKHPHYEHRTSKLDSKDNKFTREKFQIIRKYSTHKKILESFKRIGMCLNNKQVSEIPNENELDKVCFILMNDYEDEDDELGVGPLNDGYLIGSKEYRLGFKVFFLYNCSSQEFTNYLKYMIQNTKEILTVFYSGKKDPISKGIQFTDGTIIKLETDLIISKNCQYNQNRVIFITDCPCGGSVFKTKDCSNVISFSVKKKGKDETKAKKMTHGIATYYLCKFALDTPKMTPNQLIDQMNSSLSRFNEIFKCELSCKDFGDNPIFE